MRLLLDAHLSGRNIGRPLRARGHDVLVVDEDRNLEGLEDEPLLQLASDDTRILITANAKDFLPIVRDWAGAGKTYAGCILIPYSFRQDQFGAIIAGIEALLAASPEQEDWIDRTEWLSRSNLP